jgi:predicted phage tail protein
MLVNVRLVGEMGRLFGANHAFHVDSASEVFQALAANYEGFRAYLRSSERRGVKWRVIADDVMVDVEQLKSLPAPSCLVVAPIAIGSGGVGKIIAGVAILAFAAFVPFSIGLLGSGVITGTQIGAAVLLSGLSQVLAPGDKVKSPQSTSINPQNTVTDGDVIPIVYGKVFIAGKVISAGSTVNRR